MFPTPGLPGTAQAADGFRSSSSALFEQRQAYPKLLPSRLGCKVPASPHRGIWEQQSPLSSMAGCTQAEYMRAYIQVMPIQLLLRNSITAFLPTPEVKSSSNSWDRRWVAPAVPSRTHAGGCADAEVASSQHLHARPRKGNAHELPWRPRQPPPDRLIVKTCAPALSDQHLGWQHPKTGMALGRGLSGAGAVALAEVKHQSSTGVLPTQRLQDQACRHQPSPAALRTLAEGRALLSIQQG